MPSLKWFSPCLVLIQFHEICSKLIHCRTTGYCSIWIFSAELSVAFLPRRMLHETVIYEKSLLNTVWQLSERRGSHVQNVAWVQAVMLTTQSCSDARPLPNVHFLSHPSSRTPIMFERFNVGSYQFFVLVLSLSLILYVCTYIFNSFLCPYFIFGLVRCIFHWP
jgi:hypothetical protein